ncbi:hypothetical protein DF186_21655, partial [Enterococcus hirae]
MSAERREVTCVCGTTVPAGLATDWTPGCHYCERIWITRRFDRADDQLDILTDAIGGATTEEGDIDGE